MIEYILFGAMLIYVNYKFVMNLFSSEISKKIVVIGILAIALLSGAYASFNVEPHTFVLHILIVEIFVIVAGMIINYFHQVAKRPKDIGKIKPLNF